jgi:hypothetical protein
VSRDECEGDVGSAEGVYNVEGVGSGDGVTGADGACVYGTVVWVVWAANEVPIEVVDVGLCKASTTRA